MSDLPIKNSEEPKMSVGELSPLQNPALHKENSFLDYGVNILGTAQLWRPSVLVSGKILFSGRVKIGTEMQVAAAFFAMLEDHCLNKECRRT